MTKDEILAKLRDILADQVDADPAKVTHGGHLPG